MLERGLLPTFSSAVSAELRTVQAAAVAGRDSEGDASGIRDLTDLAWASIDNDESRDLDQLTVAEAIAGDAVRIRVAIADVDSLVKADSAIDAHARHNTTSVYTAAEIFPMLPEQLSTDLTSLNAGEERLAVVVDMVIGADCSVEGAEIYRARVRNHAKLANNSVAAWLEGQGAAPTSDDGRRRTGGESAPAGPGRPGHESMRHGRGALSLERFKRSHCLTATS
jgi:exoribonuclease-2